MRRPVSLDDIDDDTPLRLDVAAALAFPDGSMTRSGLRKEAQRGRLVIERIAGKDYVTMAAIREMRSRCRADANRPASTSGSAGAAIPCGSSSTDRLRSGQAAVLAMAAELKKHSRRTSPASTAPTSGTVIPLMSQSRTS
ncbi:excisionase [Prosthecomicrobium hirschii]|uniref:excisionase n=1 Tax=Prosthecodimorpha hirschii TaxID=665126 RepID=UPI001FCD7D71|nr:excisionase [Prosthecomicrobium hirschii]